MLDASQALKTLGELLRSAKAAPVLRGGHTSASTIYDLDYRVAVTASAFNLHAKTFEYGRRIRTPRLKLLQFVAVRPWLVETVRQWSRSRREPEIASFTAQALRRGFLGDRMHDSVIELLIAGKVLRRGPDHVASGARISLMDELHAEVTSAGLFEAERSALAELTHIQITEQMLEGW